jgi:predicted nucleotidyltransferase
VWLFGSLAWGTPGLDADIDLAVDGLASEHYFAALGELLAAAPAPVDLVRYEEAPAGLQSRIQADGRLLHGG